MAVRRSVMEVDVQGNWKEFLALYKKYDEQVKKLPGVWGAVSKENKATVQAVQMMTSAMMANMQTIRRASAAQATMSNESTRMAAAWNVVAMRTRETAGNVYAMVGRLMRFTGVTTAIGGLVTGGGVWGLERLASSAGAGRRSSTGLGIGYGQQRAFGLAYERLIDSMGFLGGISAGRGDITSGARVAMTILGMGEHGGNTGDVANEALQRIRRLAQRTPEGLLGTLLQTHQLGELGLGIEDLRRLRTMSDEEFGQYRSDYVRRTGQLDITDQTLRKWQELDVQLDAAGQKIKSALIDGLTALTGPLTQLSEALGDAVQSLVRSGTFKDAIEAVTKGIKWFADYVSREQFQQDVRTFIEAISMLASKTVSALRWLGLIPDAPGAAGSTPAAPPPMLRDTPGHWMYKPRSQGNMADWYPMTTSKPTMGWQGIKEWFSNLPWLPDKNRFPYGQRAGGDVPTDAMTAYMNAISGMESGGKYDIVNRTSGALGRFQVMPANVAQWTKEALGRSLTPAEFLSDPAAQDAVFRHVFGGYIKKYGNFGDAAAMWHSGRPLAGNTRADINMSTQEYVRRVSSAVPQQFLGSPRVRIDINDSTGGKVNVTTTTVGVAL